MNADRMEEMKIEELLKWQQIMAKLLRDRNELQRMNPASDEKSDVEFAIVATDLMIRTAREKILNLTNNDPDLAYL